jgi:uncharacterized protein DUF6325
MSVGGIELLAVKFPGNRFTGEIIEALDALVDSGTVRVVDLVFVSKSETGEVRALDLPDLDTESLAALEPLVEDTLGLLSADDAERMAAVLQNGSSAGLMLCEKVWSTRFNDALGRSATSIRPRQMMVAAAGFGAAVRATAAPACRGYAPHGRARFRG